MNSILKYYKCRDCGREFPISETHYLCPDCAKNWKAGKPLVGVLEVFFDYNSISRTFDKNSVDWNLFSAVDPRYFPPFPVGNTPFFRASNLSKKYENLFIKFDGLNPSGSLKDRASFLLVAEANRLGESEIACASTGNAASALASVCASAGIKAKIFVPKTAPEAKRVQMKMCGAEVVEVDGSYDDAFALSIEYSKQNGVLNRNTAYHPLTIEGKKSVALEIFEQNGFEVPDWIFVPVGDGVIISGVYKGFRDLKSAGLTKKLPKLVCVQAEKSAAIHNYISTGKYSDFLDATTVADSISVSCPSNVFMAAEAVEKSEGFSILVSDNEILSAQKKLSENSGIFAEPAAASSFAGFLKSKGIKTTDSIVLLITGNGLKDIASAEKSLAL